ncbi:hypothetical protein E1211_15200 [Micromonospora sp. 15K316]|uniref:hypothetical protein n=1 Tax=unclassified Micromonospora TaxID=2617518 RepID=UPI0010526C93|nr:MULTISPECIES: hypothetical protein [unclassified Micromonospora]TDB71808.1 hypothetical protein E1165_22025 [Micromonospora sp. KC723]TDC35653.1 hypothetical protein E1211_15200 [Micromonospora sp. 15K316]
MAAWRKGQSWRVVRSLDRLNEQLRAAFPRAVPPATPAVSWGSIADSAHSSSSDHYPHYYTALGKTAVVCARDFPHAPKLGLDAHEVAEQLRRSRDPRIGYIISNGRITGPNYGWEWDDYDGSDPHDTHIHVSTVHTARADDTRDWQIGEDDMDAKQFAAILKDPAVAGLMRALPWQYVGGGIPKGMSTLSVLNELVTRARANDGDTDEQAIVSGVLAGLTPERIAAAIPEALTEQVAEELARRLTS